MRAIVLFAAIAAAAPQMAAANDAQVTARPVENFRTLAPTATAKSGGVFIEGGYCRKARYAARPQIVQILKIDSSGVETASETARVLGATGNQSQGCGFYSARTDWSLSAGDTIQVRPLS